MSNTLRRDDLLTLAVETIKRKGTLAGRRVYAPRDVPTAQIDYPCVIAYTPHEMKNSIMAGGVPEFNTTVALQILCRTTGVTGYAAQADADDLAKQVENALLRDPEFVRTVQRFDSVETTITLNGEHEYHLAEASVTFGLEIFQDYDPGDEIEDVLEGIDIHVDAITPADATGTYANPPFPASVTPAPRTQGPDGRDEGALQIDFPSGA